MSIRFDASGDYLKRTTSLPSDTAFTMMALVYQVSQRSDWSYFLGIADGLVSASFEKAIGWSNGDTLQIYGGNGFDFGATPSVGKWFWAALTCSGEGADSLKGYWRYLLPSDGTTVDTVQIASTAITEVVMYFGNDSYDEWCDIRMACTKVWDAALTQAELELEMARMLPVRYANLHAWYPMFPGATERLVDYFSAGKTLTAVGTLTDEAGPPVGWGFADRKSVV